MSESTFDRIMKDQKRKKAFDKKYEEFCQEEKLIEERDQYRALLEEAVRLLSEVNDYNNHWGEANYHRWCKSTENDVGCFLTRVKERLEK